MDRRRVLHERSRSDLNEMPIHAHHRTSSTVTDKSSSQDGVSDRHHPTPIRNSSKSSNKTTSTSKSFSSSEAASVATFGSLPPVPPLHINKIPPLNLIKKRDSIPTSSTTTTTTTTADEFASASDSVYSDDRRNSGSRVTPLSPAAQPKRDGRFSNPVKPVYRYSIIPSTSTQSSTSRSSSSRPLPLKPILKKNKSPLPPYSPEEYEAKRSSWKDNNNSVVASASGGPPSRPGSSLAALRSVRLVNSNSDMADSMSRVSSPSVNPRSTLSPVSSLRQSSIGGGDFAAPRNYHSSSADNTRSTRSGSASYWTSSRNTSDQYPGHGRVPSDSAIAGPSNLPQWARKYYGSGERGLEETTEEHMPQRGHTRRARSQGDSLNISEILDRDPLRRMTYPAYLPSSQGSDLTRWPSPHLDAPPPARTESIRQPHLLFFCFGFIFPILWILGAFWPLGIKPHERVIEADPELGLEAEVELYFTEEEERKYSNAKWWRRVNRAMAAVGVLLCGTIITLGILGWKMIPAG